MCGITGLFARRGESQERLYSLVTAMAARIAHRGPDDTGVFADADAGLALGFRRLSIIDLSEAGHQPMISASGRYALVFNGEIYNFADLRTALEREGHAPAWRGHSDSEVALACIEAWGLEATVGKFVGMFGFALWDRRTRTLHLVRDRFGVKPIYYGWAGQTWLFGSELKALTTHPEFDRSIDRDALALYARYAYIPAPYTIYSQARKLPAGSILSIPFEGTPEPRTWWSAAEAATRGIANRFSGSDEDALNAVEAMLRESVRLRMISDVPLGVFLSGGVDSSTVAALMQAQNSAPVKTFTIGFAESEWNEADDAAAVAKHLRTEHTELRVSAQDALDVVPLLPSIYDEPFADASQIPTYLVSKLARQSVTVALSGDGGDELFGGYNRYFIGRTLWRRFGFLPRHARRAASALLRSVPIAAWNSALAPTNRLVPRGIRRERAGERIHKLAHAMAAGSPDVLFQEIVSQWTDIVPGAREPLVAITDKSRWPPITDYTERHMYLDQVSYLPDDILVKVDRASMAVSLEAREPLLDHRLAELAWTLPLHMKIRGGQGKWLLRRLLTRYIPEQLIDRPKRGFGLPIGAWLRGPLRGWAESLLDERRLKDEGFFAAQPIVRKWREHLSGKGEWQQYLWTILMFQAWLESNRP